MPRWNTPVRDWSTNKIVGRKVTKAQRKFLLESEGLQVALRPGIRTLQEGVMEFTRKKKNGCRLASNAMVKHGGKTTQRKHKISCCSEVFKPIPL